MIWHRYFLRSHFGWVAFWSLQIWPRFSEVQNCKSDKSADTTFNCHKISDTANGSFCALYAPLEVWLKVEWSLKQKSLLQQSWYFHLQIENLIHCTGEWGGRCSDAPNQSFHTLREVSGPLRKNLHGRPLQKNNEIDVTWQKNVACWSAKKEKLMWIEKKRIIASRMFRV